MCYNALTTTTPGPGTETLTLILDIPAPPSQTENVPMGGCQVGVKTGVGGGVGEVEVATVWVST